MSITVPAIYEDGVFRPLTPVAGLADGTSVILTVQDGKRPQQEEAKRSLSSKEVHELIKSKNPHAEPIPDELWEEIERATEIALSNVRDPEVMRKAAERMDRRAEQIYKREGLLDIAVPYLRESRDEE
jgi:predicted DNA-binding antitoxin AbrB/MazE fold protein